MQRIKAIESQMATGKVKELLDAVQSKLGLTPNSVRTMASSPAVLEAYLNFGAAVAKGVLSAKLREQIALVVAETNQCDYCLAAHTAIGSQIGLSEEAILGSRRGLAGNSRDAAVLQFAREVVKARGAVKDKDVDHLRTVGIGDGEIAEIMANVALNLFTNYFNHVAGTEVDFPPAPALGGTHLHAR
jgi:uncharacterized peroxidase-related enzyme